jgi:hypothetical protein
MESRRHLANVVITRQDFLDSGWKAVVENDPRPDHALLWREFSVAAEAAQAAGETAKARVLRLLSDVSSMRLVPRSIHEPFKPFLVMEDGRSSVLGDLTNDDIAFFATILDDIDHTWLKARVADLLWLLNKPRRVADAYAAIDAYRAIPLGPNTWHRGARQAWERAIVLARQVGKGASKRLAHMEAELHAAFEGAGENAPGFCMQIAESMHEQKINRTKAQPIAEKLKALAQHCSDEGDLNTARELFHAASEWFKTAKEVSLAIEMTVALAEHWVKEALARSTGHNPSHMAATTFVERAIKVYRTVPRAQRAAHNVDQRIAELRDLLKEVSEKSLDEMVRITSPAVDLTKTIRHSRKRVQGKALSEALVAFSTLYTGPNASEERSGALEMIQAHPLRASIPNAVMSKDGRTVAQYPGFNGDGSPGDDSRIRLEMVNNFLLTLGLVVSGEILPALRVLSLEHRLTEGDFIELARLSPIVPPGRERSFGRGLFMGYDEDFAGAIHFLVPQIEHMVRFHLKRARAKTSTLDSAGIENENGLSTLMELPEATALFGENLVFEIRSLFCGPSGPNLRNQFAHGLLDDDEYFSPYAVYAWWLCFRLVYGSFFNATRKRQPPENSSSEPT